MSVHFLVERKGKLRLRTVWFSDLAAKDVDGRTDNPLATDLYSDREPAVGSSRTHTVDLAPTVDRSPEIAD